jgi:hypothetical protein
VEKKPLWVLIERIKRVPAKLNIELLHGIDEQRGFAVASRGGDDGQTVAVQQFVKRLK